MSKNPQALKDAEHEIYIIGSSQDLICTALSLLWFLEKSPTALIGEEGEMQDARAYGIPILPLDIALAGKMFPVILLCSYDKAHVEKLTTQVKSCSAVNPVFWSPYDIEQSYIEKKRSAVSLSKIETLIGVDTLPCGALSRYMCSVEQDYERMMEDIEQVASHALAIKYLEIRVPSALIDLEFTAFLKKVYAVDNVFSVKIKTDPYHEISANVLKELEQFILKIDFYNYPGAKNDAKVNIESLIGRIPFSYTEKSVYPPQTVGYDERPLTISHLSKLIAKDLGIEIQSNIEDDREICLVDVSAGLGNQILLYLLACRISENASKLVVINDTTNHVFSSSRDAGSKMLMMGTTTEPKVKKSILNTLPDSAYLFKGLELCEIFPCEFRLLSELFNNEVRDMFLKRLEQYVSPDPMFSYLSALNCKVAYYSDRYVYKRFQVNAKNYISIDRYHTDSDKLSSSVWLAAPMKNSYYANVFLTNFHSWNKSNRKWAQSKLKFPPIADEYNLHIAAQIMDSNSVVIHVRRRDIYSINSGFNPQHGAYFRAAICAVMRLTQYGGKKYFVFSDDVEWCRTHEAEVGFDLISSDIVYVDQNAGKSSFRDMQLMSMGKIMIFPPNSSFSFCAFILNAVVEKYVSFQHYKALLISETSEKALSSKLLQDAR